MHEDKIIPMSFAQKRLWFLDKLHPNQGIYNIPFAADIRGKIEIPLLERAFCYLIARHEILRTSFDMIDDEPVQIIHEKVNFNIEIYESSSLSKTEYTSQELRLDAATHYFNLSKTPLILVKLIKNSQEHHELLITIHHIIADGWSIGIFLKELSMFYNTFVKHIQTNLPELEIQYSDFSLWQTEYLTKSFLKKQLDYWTTHLLDAPGSIQLPVDKAQLNQSCHDGKCFHYPIQSDVIMALKHLGEKNNCTSFMSFLAVFYLLIYRYSNQNDIVIGTPIANRHYPGVEHLIGFFVNTLALRVKLQGSFSFLHLLSVVREISLKAYENQDVPFEQVVESLKLNRELDKNPLFQIMFDYDQQLDDMKLNLDGTDVKIISQELPLSKFDLTFLIQSKNNTYHLIIEYKTEIFDSTTIEQMAKHYINLIKKVLTNPNAPLDTINLLTEEEYQRIIYNWNDTRISYPLDKTISQLFEEKAKSNPNQIAVIFEDQVLSYEELNTKANRLAWTINEYKSHSKAVIGIYCNRSIDFLTGIIATFKIGGTFIPLDPTHPNMRVLQLINQCQTDFILTSNKYTEQLKNGIFPSLTITTPKIIILDGHGISNRTMNLPLNSTINTDPAYIIFTSGSTGEPKGAIVSMRGTVNHALAMIDTLNFNESDILAQTAPQSCDISVWQFITPLVAGGTVCILNDDNVKDINLLIKAIEKHSISIYQIVVSQFMIFLEELEMMKQERPLFSNLRWMIPCGEALPPSLCRSWLHMYNIKLLNAYGPAECSDDVTTYCIESPPDKDILYIPIGKPLPNNKVYVLNKQLSPVPIGVIGELYIAGIGVGNGYLNNPKKTEHSFINNPFDKGKMYKTGDLVKYSNDGNLIYLGRQDQQVKIRGYRVEIGEVEATISKFYSVQQAAVLVEMDIHNHNNLVAFILPAKENLSESGKDSLIHNIRVFLSERLPNYMIPTSIIVMGSLPLLENGKLDRKSLGKLIKHTPFDKQITIAPRDHIETDIASIWKEILNMVTIGVDENFFILGGHSLSATQIMLRVCRHFQIELPLKTLFIAPTIAGLALHVKTKLTQINHPLTNIPVPKKRAKKIPLSYAQERLWFLSKLLPTKALYTTPLIFSLKGKLDQENLELSFKKLIARHEILRTIIQIDKKTQQPIQKIFNEVNFKIDVTNVKVSKNKQESFVKELIRKELSVGLDIEKEPALKVKIFNIGVYENVLLILMHHIITDGWSMAILTKEISELYNASIEKRTPQLPDLQLQYADYSIWQKQNMNGVKYEHAMQFWQNHLLNAPEVFQLSANLIRPPLLTYSGKIYQFTLSAKLLTKLKQLCIHNNTTLFMSLIGIFYTLLYRYSGQTDIVIGVPVANRNQPEIENLIGFFVNMLPLRIQSNGDSNFSMLLKQLSEMVLNAFEHQYLPFEKLVEKLKIERSINTHPIFQVAFILQNTKNSAFYLNNIQSNEISVDLNTSRFDLTLFAEEIDNRLSLCFEYSTELFEPWIIEQMANHFESLAVQIVDSPSHCISKINYLSSVEKNQFNDWNFTTCRYPSERLIHDLFEQQVILSPQKIAIIHNKQSISYEVLNTKANQLARYIKRINPTSKLIAVSLERNIDMIISLFAILKSGSAYLPLDPAYPSDRLALMKSIAQPDILIVQNSSAGKGIEENCNLIILEQDWEHITKEDEYNLIKTEYLPTNLAYVIFTSGSTGVPKGVMMHHQGTINRLNWMWEKYPFDIKDVCCQKTSLNFGDSVWEIFGPLLKGVTTVLIDDSTLKDHKQFIKTLKEQNVTRIVLVPSLLHSLLTYYSEDLIKLPLLNFWTVSGEALSDELVSAFFNILPNATLLNLYGSSEVAADVTYFEINDLNKHIRPIPIGKPISNTKVYILDENQELLPKGMAGELYIAGAGLASGYLNQKTLTDERFISNPFDQSKIYNKIFRTGDVARFLPDGNIVYLGRTDFQIKVRGFRIELGDIENSLRLIDGVEQAVVNLEVSNMYYENKIIAYIIRDRTENFSKISENVFGEQIRASLTDKLPTYMIPNIFILLDKFPLTPSGKIDRNRLHKCSGNKLSQSTYTNPRNAFEFELSTIWEKVLKRKCIGVNDNFFEIGGHSLLAIRLTVEINQSMNENISVIDIFTHPTIAKIAALVGSKKSLIRPNLFLSISKADNVPPLFLIHPAGGLSFVFLSLTKYVTSHCIYAINNPFFGQTKNKFKNLQEMASYYMTEIAKIHSGPFRLGGYSFGGLVAYEIACQLEKIGKKVEFVMLIDSYHPSLFKNDENKTSSEQKIQQHLISEGLLPGTKEFNEMMAEMMHNDELSKCNINQPCKAKLYLLKALTCNPVIKNDPFHGWSSCHKDTIHVNYLEGEHNKLFSELYIQDVAKTINHILDNCVA